MECTEKVLLPLNLATRFVMDMHCVLFEAGTECVCVCKFAQRLSGLNVTVR